MLNSTIYTDNQSIINYNLFFQQNNFFIKKVICFIINYYHKKKIFYISNVNLYINQ